MRDHILLYVNHARHEIRGAAVFQPLSTFLRESLHLIGTKIVCAEGDCGSCTTLLGRLPSPNSSLNLAPNLNPNLPPVYSPICSCIQYICQLDCTHIITIEGLTYDDNATGLNPLQQSFCKHHGAQCGFCTPGFIVATSSLLDQNPQPTEPQIRRALTGNLCRCTGYEPIIQATLDVPAASLRKISSLFDTPKITADLASHQSDSLRIPAANQLLLKPATLADALTLRRDHPAALLISGGTDLGVFVNKGKRELATVISLAHLPELRQIKTENNTLIAGGAVTLTELESAARTTLPELARMLDRFGSPLIRNAGTLAGNIANGSPIGDTMPALFVLNATLDLASSRATRTVNINNFYTGYRKNILSPDELLTRITIPLPAPSDLFRLYKVSKRLDLDISTLAAAIFIQCHERPAHAPLCHGHPAHAPSSSPPTPHGNGHAPIENRNSKIENPHIPTIAECRIAFAGVAPTIIRLPKTESFLRGQPFTESTFAAAAQIARAEIRPISDVRGTADYRLQLAENTLPRFFSDTATLQPV